MTLSASAAVAGWTMGPITNAPRGSRIVAMNCYSAVLERCQAVGELTPSAPSWWRSERSNLHEVKTHLKLAVPHYYSALALDPNDQANGIGGSPFVVTGLLAGLNLPQNYLDYTPYRCLNGVGPFTTDVSVGRAHGWTNASTASGGTVFPSGRAQWYTTDYGWLGISNIVSCLKTSTWSRSHNAYIEPGADITVVSGLGEDQPTWTGAVAAAEASWPSGGVNWRGEEIKTVMGRVTIGPQYDAWISSSSNDVYVGPYSCSATAATTYCFWIDPVGGFGAFDSSVTTGWNFRPAAWPSNVPHCVIGNTNKPAPWPEIPAPGIPPVYTGSETGAAFSGLWPWDQDWIFVWDFEYP